MSPRREALEYIGGYMILNDERQRSDRTGQTGSPGKTFDNFAPCGPFLLSADELPDPGNLEMKLWVNDRELQTSIPGVGLRLPDAGGLPVGGVHAGAGGHRGDGHPRGLAKFRKPTTFMQVGDVCAIEIEKLGRLTNRIVAEEGNPIVTSSSLRRAARV